MTIHISITMEAGDLAALLRGDTTQLAQALKATVPTVQPLPAAPKPTITKYVAEVDKSFNGNRYDMPDDELLSRTLAALRTMAVDGEAPSMPVFEARRHEFDLPGAATIGRRLDKTYTRLAELAGLKPAKNGRKPKGEAGSAGRFPATEEGDAE
jgi:hypothetical protein